MRKLLIIGLLFFCSVSWGQTFFLKDNQNRQVYFDKEFVKWLNFFESRYVQLIPNGPLVDIFGGNASLPYVSGVGVDQIFDLSPLSDNRWNKNAYIGNSFGLPEYYDFPYISEIYFDTGNPFHWKIKDFHYRYYEEQADVLTNIGFAKLTYSNGVLQSSDELLLYSEEQTEPILANIKKYIGILPDYYGPELVTNSNFDSDNNNDSPADNWLNVGNQSGTVRNNDASPPSPPNVYEVTASGSYSPGGNYIALKNNDNQLFLTSGINYMYSFKAKTISGNIILENIHTTIPDLSLTSEWITYDNYFIATSTAFRMGLSLSGLFRLDDVSLKQAFINYYKNETP